MSKPSHFINKLYEIVSDPFTNDLIAWEPNGQCFIVYRPNEFSMEILPRYFKHSNFSSFVRQLNQYGFVKIEPDKWVFGHLDFKWGQEGRLSLINRKKQEYFRTDGPFAPEDFGKKFSNDMAFLRRYRGVVTKDILEVCRRQENFLFRQRRLETLQQKLETEVNNLKSLIFRYFSRILLTGCDIDTSLKPFYSKKGPDKKLKKPFKLSSNWKGHLNLSVGKREKKP